MEFNTIQNAIENSDNGDTVLVGRNRYRERVNFNGLSISVLSQFVFTGDREDIEQTIIDGRENEGSVVVVRTCQQAVLSGFTITGGFTDFGGAVYCRESNATFSHLIVEENEVDRNGAGIYCTRQGDVLIHDVIIRNNTAGYVGGGFSCYGGANVTMRNVLMYDNECDHVGGALHNYRAELTLENVTLTNNYALHSGGALYVTQAGRVHINNSILWENNPHEIYIMSGNDTTNVEMFFSDVEGGSDEIVDYEGGHFDWGVGNIDVDPEFEDGDEGDFTLADDSPCIDAGHLEYEPDPDGTRRDIGAYYSHQEDDGSYVLHVPDDFDTVQEAIDEANDGDVVLVQPGEYFENLEMSSNITLGSRFISTGDEEFIESTVIDGDGEGTVLLVSGDIPDAIVSGFTIQNGEAGENVGGGIACRETNITIANMVIQNNHARQGGGVHIRNDNGNGFDRAPTLTHVTIIGNEAGVEGGGIYLVKHPDNDEETNFVNVQIIDNEAQEFGGGISMAYSNSILQDVIISDNSSNSGGGVSMLWSDPEFSRVILSGNASGSASALRLRQSNPNFNNVTIASNDGDENSAVIWLGRDCSLEITNSIVWGNEPAEIQLLGEGNSILVQYSDIENGEDAITGDGEIEWGEGNIDTDPLFTNAEENDYTLSDNSPCIDAGDPEATRDPDGTIVDMGAFYKEQEFDYRRLFMVPDDYETIQEAIDVTQWGDSILVRPGRYEENIDMGGHSIFLGSLFAITHDPEFIESTIIDGGENDVTVKYARGEAGTLRGFRIENGRSREGGGIFIYNSSPDIEYCTFTDNSAEDGGGGIFCYGGTPDFKNCTISGNRGDEGAGGFHFENGAWVRMESCIFWGNEPEEIVFSADGDPNTVIVNYTVIDGGEGGIILNDNGGVRWEEGNIDQDPRFVDGENGDYYLTENSPCIDAGAHVNIVDPDGTPADIGAYYFDQGGEVIDFSIRLSLGWNVISSPVQPPVLSMESVFGEIIERENLLIVKSQEGRFFRPDHEFNNINGWDVRYGYWVKVSEAEELIISNRFVQEDIPIPLDDGWSIVSYFPQQETNVEVATEMILEELIIIKDSRGLFYLPEYDFSNMEPLEQGKGYQLKVDDDIDLVWNTEGERLNGMYGETNYSLIGDPTHFSAKINSRFNMSVLITASPEIIGECELGAFDADGHCIGAVRLNPDGMTGFALWGDDIFTNEIEGLHNGDQPTFRVWLEESEIPAQMEWIKGDGRYQTDGYAIGELLFEAPLPRKFTLDSPYPNPFNSRIRLSFALPEAGITSLSVYDVSGRLVSQNEQYYHEAGRFQISLNAAKWSSGIYLAELKAGNKVRMKKMVLVK